MSKVTNKHMIMKNFENKVKIKKNIVISENMPTVCQRCGSENIDYWDETDEEIIFRCLNCKQYIPIPFDIDDLRLYFSF